MWPKVEPKLLRLLEKRGLTKPQAEDVCQDVAVRALASGVEFESADDLYRWAGQVARNLHIDLLRSTSRIACDDTVLVEMQADTDVEHEVERRIALAKVLKHWLTLRPLDQAALLEGMYADGNEDRGEAVKLAVRRHRARARLRVLAEGLFGLTGAAALLRRTKSLVATAPAATMVAAPVAFLLVSPVFAPPQAAGDHVTTSPVPRVARLVVSRDQMPAQPAPAAVSRPVAKPAAPADTDSAPKKAPAPERVRAEVPGGGVDAGEAERRWPGTYACVDPIGPGLTEVCVRAPEHTGK